MKKVISTLAMIVIAINTFAQYCNVWAQCDEYISNVAFGTINNGSDCTGGGYTDYSSMAVNIVPGEYLNITVTNGILDYPEDQCGIWVDWNNNGDFTDDSVITVYGTPGIGPYTATVLCPVGTSLGDKRMRVRVLYTGTVSPCDSTDYGETEDYTLRVVAPAEHDMEAISLIAPVSGPSLTANENVTVKFKNLGTSTEFSVPVSYKINNGSVITEVIGVPLLSLNEINYTFTTKADLSIPATDYIIKAWVNVTGDTCINNDTITVTVRNTFGDFCNAGSTYPYDEGIADVEIGTISNSSYTESGGYADYTYMSTDIFSGKFDNITVGIGGTTSSDDQCGIWVDWNDNHDFTDDPAVIVNGTPGVGSFNASINCPLGTTTGDKRMRIRLMRTGTLSSCGTTDYGEVEDYTLHVIEPPAHDMETVSLIAPVSGPSLTSSENIIAEFRNSGSSSEINSAVSYQVDNGPVVTETIGGSFPGFTDTIYTFAAKADLSIINHDYTVKVWTGIPGDENHDNDTIEVIVSNTLGNYCKTNLGGGSCPSDITEVSITGTTLNNTNHYSCSSANGSIYGYYPAVDSTTGTLAIGGTYELSVTTNENNIISVWIDYNRNGTFEAKEWNQVATSTTPGVANKISITVPISAYFGQTGMRIRSRLSGNQNGASDACLHFGSGIAEDYIITLIVPTLSVTPANQDVTEASGTTDFTVTSNTSWTASSDSKWCSVTPSGTGNGTITATYDANPDLIPRTATITISAPGLSDQTVTVTQAEFVPILIVTPTNRYVVADSALTYFTVTSNIDWTASSNTTWCMVITPSGTGYDTIKVIDSANLDTGIRIATITVSGLGVSRTVKVNQLGTSPILIVTPSVRNVSNTSGTTSFLVASNTDWTASSNQTWCTVTPSGNDFGNITATYTANADTTSRSATITVSGTGVSDQTITVNQAKLVKVNLAAVSTDSKLNLYPNPSRGLFNIKFKSINRDFVTITIFDNLGRVVYEKGNISIINESSIILNLENLSNAVYVIQFRGSKIYEKQLIVIQK